jgi:hypothetical protein
LTINRLYSILSKVPQSLGPKSKPEEVMAKDKEDADKDPVCPHCSKEVSPVELKAHLTRFGPESQSVYLISCPHCRKILGVTQIGDCTVEGLND